MFLYLETLSIFEFIRQKMRYFETRFLEEADAFMATLDFKSVKKILYNIDSAEQTNDPKLLKNFKMTFGSSEPNMLDCNLDYLPFGTKQIRQQP